MSPPGDLGSVSGGMGMPQLPSLFLVYLTRNPLDPLARNSLAPLDPSNIKLNPPPRSKIFVKSPTTYALPSASASTS